MKKTSERLRERRRVRTADRLRQIRLDVPAKNGRAIRFYEKNGFVPDGRKTEIKSLGAVVIGMSRKGK